MAAPLQALRAFKAEFLGNQEPDYAVAPLLDIYQKDWQTWLQDKCGFAAHRYRRGSIGRITRGMCGMRPTGERVLELEMMVRQDVRE
ncbi:lysozyme inhibitor LprI family protein [Hyphomonas sp.]|uniref:lysozyme inhibitor LprI family protein n=1 Tax=Hyphomonas sp. TaxID=87 RepID=UPI0039E28C11